MEQISNAVREVWQRLKKSLPYILIIDLIGTVLLVMAPGFLAGLFGKSFSFPVGGSVFIGVVLYAIGFVILVGLRLFWMGIAALIWGGEQAAQTLQEAIEEVSEQQRTALDQSDLTGAIDVRSLRSPKRVTQPDDETLVNLRVPADVSTASPPAANQPTAK